ncbi:hypothetical protein DMH04_09190 [Kibdelosporangium aridum]|uniref:Uncharacterized protein n=1 Tax=Kibdelosporangium aridum TaxID=2030 RepID=A0A428ZIU7_KIBAR|nr:hypothetical protein [Kibdelosporangium aridum]RSM87890.1 hypothetical protein DMH04_09190 [Kibdelosporangium aridum]
MGDDKLSEEWLAKIRQAAEQPKAKPSSGKPLPPKLPSMPKVSVDLSRTAKPYTEPFVEKLLAQLCHLLEVTAQLLSKPRYQLDVGLYVAFQQGDEVAAGLLRPDPWWKLGRRRRPRPEHLNPAIRLLRTELFRVAPELNL